MIKQQIREILLRHLDAAVEDIAKILEVPDTTEVIDKLANMRHNMAVLADAGLPSCIIREIHDLADEKGIINLFSRKFDRPSDVVSNAFNWANSEAEEEPWESLYTMLLNREDPSYGKAVNVWLEMYERKVGRQLR